MGAIASQFTSPTIVYSAVYSDGDQRRHQSSASLAFVRGIHRGPVNSPHKWPVTRKMVAFDNVIMRVEQRNRLLAEAVLKSSFLNGNICLSFYLNHFFLKARLIYKNALQWFSNQFTDTYVHRQASILWSGFITSVHAGLNTSFVRDSRT